MDGDVGATIRRERLRQGWSQPVLAERADVSVDWVRSVEQGRVAKPQMEHLLRVAAALGIPATMVGVDNGPVEYFTPDQVTDLNASFHTLKKLTPRRLEEARRFLEVFAAMGDDDFQNPVKPE